MFTILGGGGYDAIVGAVVHVRCTHVLYVDRLKP